MHWETQLILVLNYNSVDKIHIIIQINKQKLLTWWNFFFETYTSSFDSRCSCSGSRRRQRLYLVMALSKSVPAFWNKIKTLSAYSRLDDAQPHNGRMTTQHTGMMSSHHAWSNRLYVVHAKQLYLFLAPIPKKNYALFKIKSYLLTVCTILFVPLYQACQKLAEFFPITFWFEWNTCSVH